MRIDSLKSYRIPYEIECCGITIQLVALGKHLALRIVKDPKDDGEFENLIRVDECPVLQCIHPECFRAYRLSNGKWSGTRHQITRLGFHVIHWNRPRD